MIGYLSGKIISAKPTKILLDVNGVGYLVNISINTFENIGNKQSVSLYIHTNVKEDSITLFGFYAETEKDMFELLISVNGVGPRLAISILSGIRVDDLKNAIQSGAVHLPKNIAALLRGKVRNNKPVCPGRLRLLN